MSLVDYRKTLFLFLFTLALIAQATPAEARILLGASNNTSLSNGLVGYWPLDGAVTNWNTNTTLDLSGQGNTGQLNAMSTTSSPVAGKIGQALKLDGTDDYVNLGKGSSLDFQTGSMSISAWVNFDSTSGGHIVSAIDSSLSFAQEDFAVSNGSLTFQVFGDASNFKLWGTAAIVSSGKWYHIVATRNGSSLNDGDVKIYVNGDSKSLTPIPVGTPFVPALASVGNLSIGRSGDSNSGYFKGKIDDVRIYNRALSASEIAQLYKLGTANAAHSQSGPNAPLSNGLVGYWTSDGGATNWATGQTQDATGNGYTGSLIAMSTSSSPVAGKIGQALKFNGANYTRVPSAPNLDIAAYTISGWVNGSNTNKDIISIIYSTAAAEQRIIINSAYVFISNDDNGLGIDCITRSSFLKFESYQAALSSLYVQV